MSELLLGLDIGTASSKAVLATPEGNIVARATREHAVSLPRPGWVEHDAEAIWWADVRALCAQLGIAERRGLAGVCVSGIGPCLLPCDPDWRPLRPAILYGVDTRATDEIEDIERELGVDAIFARCGSALSSQALGPKLLWLRRNEPDVWARMARWTMASSFVVGRLTGEWVLDHSSASQCDPFYDLLGCGWASDWIETVLPGLELPRLVWPSEVAGTVTPYGAAESGIPAGTPVAAGTIDAWAEAVSVGVRRPGELMLMYGSTMFLVLGTRTPSAESSIWTTRGVDPNSLTVAAGMSTSGSLASWFRDVVGGVPFETLAEEASRVPAGSDGLVALPYFAGERTPILDPHARGTIIGLTLRHQRGHLYRALLESLAYAVRHNLAAMGDHDISQAVAVGGGTRGRLWVQTVSDVCGIEQSLPRETIGASYGDARLAAESIGLVAADEPWVLPRETESARDLSQREVYNTLYMLYRELYPATRDIAHSLSCLQEEASMTDLPALSGPAPGSLVS